MLFLTILKLLLLALDLDGGCIVVKCVVDNFHILYRAALGITTGPKGKDPPGAYSRNQIVGYCDIFVADPCSVATSMPISAFLTMLLSIRILKPPST